MLLFSSEPEFFKKLSMYFSSIVAIFSRILNFEGSVLA